ncbi:MAG: helix-turn-helix domain-containing protein [Kineosporiaceae bacterium]
MSDWLTVSEAARLLGVSPGRIRQLASAGDLGARRHSGVWLIDPGAVAQRAAQPTPPGRPVAVESCWLFLGVLTAASALLDPGTAGLAAPTEQARPVRGIDVFFGSATAVSATDDLARLEAGVARWLDGARAVAPGPTAPLLVQRLLAAADEELADAPTSLVLSAVRHALQEPAARRRIRALCATAPGVPAWPGWLAGRARTSARTVDVRTALAVAADERLALTGWHALPGAPSVVASLGGIGGPPAGALLQGYVRERDLAAITADHALDAASAPSGAGGSTVRVVLRELPRQAPQQLRPRPGRAVPTVVAALDTLDAGPTEARGSGQAWLEAVARLVQGGVPATAK